MSFVDTHSHIYSSEFDADREEVLTRAVKAGADKIFLPNENAATVEPVLALCRRHPRLCYPMIGLHPEEITDDDSAVLDSMESMLRIPDNPFIAIGEIGLDYHFRNDNRKAQIAVFKRQTLWAAAYNLPLMIHARDSIADVTDIISACPEGTSGVFHCFTGSADDARKLLSFPRFMLGIGGVVTFKSSRLAQTLASAVPLSRIVLETDSPYMAPVPMRGRRNESAFVPYVAEKLADVYGTTAAEVCRITTENAQKMFPKAWK